MGRQTRTDRQDGWHHVVNRGVARMATFHDDADRVEFGRLLAVGHDRFGVEVHAYCLMTNHFHLVLHCPEGGLSEYMHLLTSVHARHVNDRAGRDGPLYRGRFTSRHIRDALYLRNAVRYVHRNPLAIDPLTPLKRYRWSSHRTYLGMRRRPPWLRTDAVLGLFDDDPAAFHAFVVDEHEVTPSPDVESLDAAVGIVAETIADELPRSRQGLERTLTLLAADLLPAEVAEQVLDGAGVRQGRPRLEAQWRARRLAAATPLLLAAARRSLDLAASLNDVPGTTFNGVRRWADRELPQPDRLLRRPA